MLANTSLSWFRLFLECEVCLKFDGRRRCWSYWKWKCRSITSLDLFHWVVCRYCQYYNMSICLPGTYSTTSPALVSATTLTWGGWRRWTTWSCPRTSPSTRTRPCTRSRRRRSRTSSGSWAGHLWTRRHLLFETVRCASSIIFCMLCISTIYLYLFRIIYAVLQYVHIYLQ